MLSSSIAFIDHILTEAMEKGASDIHIDPCSDYVMIKYRIHGSIYDIHKLPLEGYERVVGRIKIMSQMDTIEKRMPQEGKFQFKFKEELHDIRVSILPTIKGEKVSIRILYNTFKIIELDNLGFDDKERIKIKRLLSYSQGMILITGPTGSGKTTTLYGMLNEIHNENNNIITLEEPVEYSIDGINQVNVNNRIGLTFSKGLKSIIRQDPDVIMVGEIRDKETAEISVRASITGHLVMSTIHTPDAATSLLRLIDMGIPKYLVVDSIEAVIAQRLIKTLCPYCKEEDNSMDLEVKIYKSKGCDICDNIGYLGRTLVYELMEIDERHKDIIINNFSISALRNYSIKSGMKSMKVRAMDLVKKGITSLEEVNKL
ncbi:GspE/PulE family protein [Clostridium sp. MSJ-11]|uniref:GspE/PulE family protein n=1 Tax=Clostridium mobile TaxID=2841512 RepID=A0ABS6ECN6_9CLOT|nr:GspE/PulE family protein [Clostridium mobile]MBU5482961.1 GspE/PulE family protein [Clostridium mobile]